MAASAHAADGTRRRRSLTLTFPPAHHPPDWIAKKPDKYCSKSKYKDKDGWKAKEACRVTCETCEEYDDDY